MSVSLVLAFPLAVTWMLVTGKVTLESFLVGLVIGILIAFLVRTEKQTTAWHTLPEQLWALILYILRLFRDIWLSSVDVAKRVLNPKLPIKPGILAVPTQDERGSEVVAAFSAHGITITPGELVLDFDGAQVMYVHCLDIEASAQSAQAAQTKRLRQLNRILGRSALPAPSIPVDAGVPSEASS